MEFDGLQSALEARIAAGLPGTEAQLRMAPRPRPGWDPGALPDDYRAGAGLLLVYPTGGTAHLLLTVRSSELPFHPGQVSLPGGALEDGETIESAALRESAEEVGLDPAGVRIAGRLTPLHIPASGFVLWPVLGFVEQSQVWLPEPGEVERVLEVPIESLGDPACLGSETRVYRGRDIEVPYFDLDGPKLWGATAMIVCELLDLVGIRPQPWG
jgi:8-oxo-dGTP pyrophosphatase MutT (NUDIX family)